MQQHLTIFVKVVYIMKNLIPVFLFGSLVDEKKRANRGENIGFCGQSFGGSLYGYTYGVGIYTMKKDPENDCMHIEKIVADMDTIRNETRNYFKKKRFLFVVNDSENVNFYEFLASRNIEAILQNASLNTNKRIGLCFRDVKGFGDVLAVNAEKIASIAIPDFCNLYNEKKAEIGENFNLGNFCEYILSNKETDINASRFDAKKQDLFLNGKRYELKTSLNIPVKDTSKSNSNFFYTL